ncbi:MAG: cytochrome c oxidase subunit II [Dehalococcoidia bacterium]
MESARGGRSFRNLSSVIALILIAILVAATMVAYFTVMQLPDPVTEEAKDIASVYDVVLALATFVFLAVEALLIWVCFRYRRQSNLDPPQVHGNNRLEFGWTAIPIVISVVLFILSAPLVIDLREAVATEDADLTVNVTGRQWFWEYEYPDQGITIQEIPDYDNPDPPSLVVPVNQKIRLNVASADVIHSFYVPRFLYKIQAIPGQTNQMHFTAEETGRFEGQCAQFCGLNHAQMLLVVEVVTQEEFDAFIEEQQAEQEPDPTPSGTPDDGQTGDDDQGGGPTPFEVTAQDNEFSTDEIRAPVGEITVTLLNEGEAIHNFSVPDADAATELIDPGEEGSVTFTIEEPGEYDFRCDVHPEEMTGTLVVE